MLHPLDKEQISTIHLDVLTCGACWLQRPAHRACCVSPVSALASLRSLRTPRTDRHASYSEVQSIELLLNKSVDRRHRQRGIDTFQLQMGFELESNKGLYWLIAFLSKCLTMALILLSVCVLNMCLYMCNTILLQHYFTVLLLERSWYTKFIFVKGSRKLKLRATKPKDRDAWCKLVRPKCHPIYV